LYTVRRGDVACVTNRRSRLNFRSAIKIFI